MKDDDNVKWERGVDGGARRENSGGRMLTSRCRPQRKGCQWKMNWAVEGLLLSLDNGVAYAEMRGSFGLWDDGVKAECSPSTKPLFVINQRLLDYLPYENSENIERKEEEEEVEDIRLGRNSGINFGMKLVGSQEEMPEESIFNSLSEDKGVRGFTGGSIVVSTLLGTIIIKILL
ncbi:uncharacterized protein EAE98_011452 [Botrytis deweyae]|uniref:Uncharacterized protein n=1 Tax=Botrytis deweyae TaxID=2478750 RepID=A0ABQ7I5X9_9HELO|nr:uncharacterized protein EAE98_011452 [Botrytis deweyae]KAF7914753.1 hypothetical protein EAE98_011452 [Botrytis deweyae]